MVRVSPDGGPPVRMGTVDSAAQRFTMPKARPNILIMWGGDIGQSDFLVFTKGMTSHKTPNIDSIAEQGML